MNSKINQFLVISFFIKCILALFIPITLDESYYFLWGQNLSLSYFDHPPMVGWLMAFSEIFRPLKDEAIRWPFIFVGQMTIWIWVAILQAKISRKKLWFFLWVASLNPLWGLGIFIATPDIPLLFCWSLGLLCVKNILDRDRWRDSLGLGLALGLGFLSKYQIVLFLPCLLILLYQQKMISRLFRLKTLVAIAVALILCLPVFYWNALHEWASFNFQLNHGLSTKYWKPVYPLDYLLFQILLIFPPFLFFLFNKDRTFLKDWLFPFVLFPFCFFLYSSFKSRVEANWVIMAFPCLYAMAIQYSSPSQSLWQKRTLGLWSLSFLASLIFTISPIQSYKDQINLFENQRFKNILPLLKENENYLAYSYQLAGWVHFNKGRVLCKLPAYGRPDHLSYLDSCKKIPPHFFYITESHHQPAIGSAYPQLKIVKEIPIDSHFKMIEVDVK